MKYFSNFYEIETSPLDFIQGVIPISFKHWKLRYFQYCHVKVITILIINSQGNVLVNRNNTIKMREKKTILPYTTVYRVIFSRIEQNLKNKFR